MALEIPSYDVDIFSKDAVRDANAVDDALREFSPVVKLADGTVMISRQKDVSAGLMDWKTFSSESRPWHDPNSVRPEILLTDVPPKHSRVRSVMNDVLSPRRLEQMAELFDNCANSLMAELRAREGETFDGVGEVAQKFVYKAFPDALGLPPGGREQMHGFSHMVWATMGPQNELYQEAMSEDFGPVVEWLESVSNRDALDPDGFGMQIFNACDEGRVSDDEAKLLLLTVLAAGADTTYITMATTLRAWAQFPDQFALVQEAPKLLRNAFDEALRWDSPSRMAGRITTSDVTIEDYVIPEGTRVGLMFGAANRDPRYWERPEAYDVNRNLRNSVGFGLGLHACVGRTLAHMEAKAFLGAIARDVKAIEIVGEVEPWMTTVGHGPAKLPVRLHFR